mmetsp:Transcript_30423/g.97285  ORF Transcript_30423/g.97285 Transcript_30423/m.97285 type:complete len:264 (-) Transcript_30423:67-858(-)
MLPLLPRMPLIRLLRRALHLAGEDGRLGLLPIEAELVAVGEHAPFLPVEGVPRPAPRAPERRALAARRERRRAACRHAHGALHARHRQLLLRHVPAAEHLHLAVAELVRQVSVVLLVDAARRLAHRSRICREPLHLLIDLVVVLEPVQETLPATRCSAKVCHFVEAPHASVAAQRPDDLRAALGRVTLTGAVIGGLCRAIVVTAVPDGLHCNGAPQRRVRATPQSWPHDRTSAEPDEREDRHTRVRMCGGWTQLATSKPIEEL